MKRLLGIIESKRCRVWKDDSDVNCLLFTQKNISSATRNHTKKPGGHTDLLANQTNELVSSRPARDTVSTNRKGGGGKTELREGIQGETARI